MIDENCAEFVGRVLGETRSTIRTWRRCCSSYRSCQLYVIVVMLVSDTFLNERKHNIDIAINGDMSARGQNSSLDQTASASSISTGTTYSYFKYCCVCFEFFLTDDIVFSVGAIATVGRVSATLSIDFDVAVGRLLVAQVSITSYYLFILFM